MVAGLDLYDLFVLCFVQLVLATLTGTQSHAPVDPTNPRLRWTGSKLTEVIVATLAATALALISCVLTSAIIHRRRT